MRKVIASVSVMVLMAGAVPADAQSSSSLGSLTSLSSLSSLSSSSSSSSSSPEETREPAPPLGPIVPATVVEVDPANPPAAEFTDQVWRDRIAPFAGLKDAAGNRRVTEFSSTSPSMDNRRIPLVVIRAFDPNRPTIYLLNGAGGGEQDVNWLTNVPVIDFYLEKNINVVIPMRGAFSYYIDWLNIPQGNKYLSGPQRWETYLTKELPTPLENALGANDMRGIVGMSMSATSSLVLAARNPGFYDVVGSYSGCAATADLLPYQWLRMVLRRDGEMAETMVGPRGGDYNIAHDALVHAEGLRGSAVYVSTGTGLITEDELISTIWRNGLEWREALSRSTDVTLNGGAIEAATNACAHDLDAKLGSLGIPATFMYRNAAVHTWRYWHMDMEDSWPTYAKGFGLDN